LILLDSDWDKQAIIDGKTVIVDDFQHQRGSQANDASYM